MAHQHDRSGHGGHAGHAGGGATDFDWAALGADLELEAKVLAPALRAAAQWVRDLAARTGAPTVRRIIDLGSGPGVTTVLLATTFADAEVVAVDGSVELLARAQARADAAGLGDRFGVHTADLAGDLGDIGRADIIWIAMALHHVGDQEAAVARFRQALRPGGLLVVVEAAAPSSYLPEHLPVDRPGLAGRLTTANAAWFAAMRAALPGSTDGDADTDLPALFRRAGLDPVAYETFGVHLDAPLPPQAQRLAEQAVARMSGMAGDRLDPDDHHALEALLDPDRDPAATGRPELHLHIDRAVYVAQEPE